MSNEFPVEHLANQFAAYVKVDKQKEMQALDEAIEDTLTRLEELEGGINMLQTERERFGSQDFTAARSNLNALCQRIHKLDEMSKIVLNEVEALEPLVNDAEINLTNSAEGKLKNMLKPLLFRVHGCVKCKRAYLEMKSETAPKLSSSSAQFVASPSFSTSSFFPKGSEDNPASTSTPHT